MAYTPTNWVDGTTIANQTTMNNMENGIVAANRGIAFQVTTGYITAQFAGGSGSSSQGTGFIRAIAVEIPVPVTVTGIGCSVNTGATSAVCRLGIYSDNGFPNTLLLDAGTVDCSTFGDKEAAVSSLALTGGRYWVVGCMQGAAATMIDATGIISPPGLLTQGAATSNGTAATGGFYNAAGGITGALPSTFGTPNGNIPSGLIRVYLKVA